MTVPTTAQAAVKPRSPTPGTGWASHRLYSTLERVEGRMRQARLLPGFRDEPECFYFDACELDEDHWTEGFVRVPPGE